VKHHYGKTGSWGQKQLEEIRFLDQEEYTDCHLALVTSGKVNPSDKERAKNNNITIIDGEELVDWIFDSLSRLSAETKTSLGISEIPHVLGS
jgi:restriction system protein